MHYDDAKFTSCSCTTDQKHKLMKKQMDVFPLRYIREVGGKGETDQGVLCPGSVAVCAMHSMQINYVTLYAKLFNLLFVASRAHFSSVGHVCGASLLWRVPNCFAIKI